MSDALKYGPQTAEVKALLARVRKLSVAEIRELDAVRDTDKDAVQYVARGDRGGIVLADARSTVRNALWDTGRESWKESALDMVRDESWYVAWDAVCALLARDLIAPDGVTQEQYDLLTRPWRRVIGQIHPRDMGVAA